MKRFRHALLALALGAVSPASVCAQGPQFEPAQAQTGRGAQPPAAPLADAGAADPGALLSGEQVLHIDAPKAKLALVERNTKILELSNRILAVEGFDPDVIYVEAVSANRVRVEAEAPGVTSLVLTDEFGAVFTIEILAEADTRELQFYLQRLFPESAIEVVPVKDSVVLRGWVAEPDRLPEIVAVAKQFYPQIHNQLKVGGPSQVQLMVKVLEVQRSKLRRMGVNFLFLGQDYMVHSGPGGLAPLTSATTALGGPVAATVNPTSLANNSLTFAIAGASDVFTGFVDALQSEGMAKVLAEPTVVATNGRPATLLSGGEFPILVPGSVGTVSIQFREFGVRMEALPIILGNGRLRLEIAPEVSERDVSSAVEINGFVVPGISTRRINTQVEMRFGETLMIGGLIQRRRNATTQKLPFLGELPYVGALFSRKSFEYGETELLILVTPQISAPLTPGQLPSPGLIDNTSDPTDKELYMYGLTEVPSYGPDCPDEDCNFPTDGWEGEALPGEHSLPGGMVAPPPYGASEPGPTPVTTTSGRGPITRTSGEQRSSRDSRVVPAGGTDPFKVDVRRKTGTRATANAPARTSGRSALYSQPDVAEENAPQSTPLITPPRSGRTYPESNGHSVAR